jgi:hypothetical protein
LRFFDPDCRPAILRPHINYKFFVKTSLFSFIGDLPYGKPLARLWRLGGNKKTQLNYNHYIDSFRQLTLQTGLKDTELETELKIRRHRHD